MSKHEILNIHNLILLDSQNKIKDRVKKGVIIHVEDKHYAQATQILELNQITFGTLRDKDLGVNTITIY